jgi:methionyl-tRNA synthetase
MVAKNLGGALPEPGKFTAADTEVLRTADGLLVDEQAMHVTLEAI